jgi:hypothetical protein
MVNFFNISLKWLKMSTLYTSALYISGLNVKIIHEWLTISTLYTSG